MIPTPNVYTYIFLFGILYTKHYNFVLSIKPVNKVKCALFRFTDITLLTLNDADFIERTIAKRDSRENLE